MQCVVYRSAVRAYTYLYLRAGLEMEELPADLRKALGPLDKVMDLNLTPDRQLAQEDTATVLANLASQGWHLQLPPSDDPSGWLDLPKPRRT